MRQLSRRISYGQIGTEENILERLIKKRDEVFEAHGLGDAARFFLGE
jgi:hypothetical protein